MKREWNRRGWRRFCCAKHAASHAKYQTSICLCHGFFPATKQSVGKMCFCHVWWKFIFFKHICIIIYIHSQATSMLCYIAEDLFVKALSPDEATVKIIFDSRSIRPQAFCAYKINAHVSRLTQTEQNSTNFRLSTFIQSNGYVRCACVKDAKQSHSISFVTEFRRRLN